MTHCPACGQPVSPDQSACRNCGISLHHEVGTSTGGSSAARSSGILATMFVVIAGLALIAVVCGGGLGFFLFQARVGPAPATVIMPVPAPPATAAVPVEAESTEMPAEQQHSEVPVAAESENAQMP